MVSKLDKIDILNERKLVVEREIPDLTLCQSYYVFVYFIFENTDM
jgi:hypothetical protein